MKKHYLVSFKKSENVYRANIVIARSIDEVIEEYSKYSWANVREATESEVRNAKMRHMPIIVL